MIIEGTKFQFLNKYSLSFNILTHQTTQHQFEPSIKGWVITQWATRSNKTWFNEE
jgi:hypothetical protein